MPDGPDSVAWGAQISARNNGLVIAAVKKSFLEAAKLKLTAIGLRLSVVTAQTRSGDFVACDRGASSKLVTAPGRRQLLINAALISLIVLVWSATEWRSIHAIERAATTQNLVLSDLRAQAVALRAELNTAHAARDQAAGIASALVETPRLDAVIALLTEATPDAAWLSSLALTGDEIRVQGFADAGAADYALALGERDEIAEARLESQVAADDGGERFEILLRFAPAER